MKRGAAILCLITLSLGAAHADTAAETAANTAAETATETAVIVQPIPGIADDFIRGADISMLAQIEEVGGKYYDADGAEKDLLVILKASGVNWIRLRLWHTPINELPVVEGGKVISNKGQRVGGGNNGLERTLLIAKRAKELGLKFLLDFHYSDFWTDPGKQKKPAAWKNLDIASLNQAIYDYTLEVMNRLEAAGARPDMVQIGNEVNNGFLWPEGKLYRDNPDEKVGGFDAFIGLLKQASKAVRDSAARRADGLPRIAIHLANGGDNGLYRSIFDPITKAGVDFDIIGLSYYPYWHGSLGGLSVNMADLAKRYRKDLVVMETAYAFTTADGDAQGNSFKVYNDATGGYLPTVQGQATVTRDVMAAVAAVPNGLGLGAFYWEPGWLPLPGAGWRTGQGSSWENQAMFDFQGKALPSLSVFKRISAAAAVKVAPKATETAKLTVTLGDNIDLPPSVKTVYTDDSWRYETVVWDDADFSGQTKAETRTLTGRLKDYDLPASIEIVFTNIKNIVPDPSFESGTLKGWTLIDPEKACLAESNSANAHSGSWTYKYWQDKAFKSQLTRTFSDIPDGDYVLKCWAMGGGGENGIKLFARDFDGGKTVSVAVENTGWQKWNQYVIPKITVVGGRCTIGINIDARAGNWGNFDDIELYLDRN